MSIPVERYSLRVFSSLRLNHEKIEDPDGKKQQIEFRNDELIGRELYERNAYFSSGIWLIFELD